MAPRKSLRLELEHLAVGFARSLVAALLSAPQPEVRDIFGAGGRSAPPDSQRRSRRRTRASDGAQPTAARSEVRVEPELGEVVFDEASQDEDVVIRDPEAMLNSLVHQGDAAPPEHHRVALTPIGPSPIVEEPKREPVTKAGEQVLRTPGGGFVLRRSRTPSEEKAKTSPSETET